ncbi:MAG: hypothetical protein KJ914_12910 [Gammaproteobacteria bacterium]|nr:hypothetical protein [Gammaproteobacteria bacterium]MBU1724830.1 hypothetical protein [Gammaproteobacteria bacterium]MBU2006507.1 hypothetical protein [Gammaproteobacteria bacterium]
MSNKPLTVDTLLEMLEDQKRTIRAAIRAAREEILDAAEKIEGKIEDIDTDSLKMKLVVAKLKAQEEWDEFEEKLGELGGKAKEVAQATEAEAKQAWDAARELTNQTVEKASDLFKKPKD